MTSFGPLKYGALALFAVLTGFSGVQVKSNVDLQKQKQGPGGGLTTEETNAFNISKVMLIVSALGLLGFLIYWIWFLKGTFDNKSGSSVLGAIAQDALPFISKT